MADIESLIGPDVGVLDGLVGYHLRRAANVIAKDFALALAGTGVRQVLFGVMSVVAANPGIRQGAVGRSLGIQRANMVALINELVEAGLLDRQVSEDDRRAFSLHFTSAGRVLFERCVGTIKAHEDRVLRDLSDADRRRLIQLLQMIAAREG